jgi:hypothetical protein
MNPKISSEQRAALATQSPGQPLRVVDDESRREFWLVASEDMPAIWAEHIRDEVQRGVDAIDRGEIVSWRPDAMKELARQAARNPASAE